MLNPKEQRFVDEYLTDLDAQRAALAAGYAATTAKVKAYGWVNHPSTKPHVYDAVQAGKESRAERLELDADEVLQHALRLSTYDVRGLFDEAGNPLPPHQLPPELARVVQGVQRHADGSYHYRLPDRNAATERLIKHLGLYERDNRQSRELGLLGVLDEIASGKSLLDLAREKR